MKIGLLLDFEKLSIFKIHPKGQKISKAIFGAFNSSKTSKRKTHCVSIILIQFNLIKCLYFSNFAHFRHWAELGNSFVLFFFFWRIERKTSALWIFWLLPNSTVTETVLLKNLYLNREIFSRKGETGLFQAVQITGCRHTCHCRVILQSHPGNWHNLSGPSFFPFWHFANANSYIQGCNKGLVPVLVLSTFSYYVLRQKCLESWNWKDTILIWNANYSAKKLLNLQAQDKFVST